MGQKNKEREKQQSNLKWLMPINMHKKPIFANKADYISVRTE